jgi:type IV secretion system protein VirD4
VIGFVSAVGAAGVFAGGFIWYAAPHSLKRFGTRLLVAALLFWIAGVGLATGVSAAGRAASHVNWTPVVAVASVVVALAVAFVLRGPLHVPGFREREPSVRHAASRSGGSLRPCFEPFVGKKGGRLRTVRAEDTIGVVGPARSGKTAGVLIPQAMMWAGPMISVSVRDDICRTVAEQRRRISAPHGGSAYVFDPTETVRRDGDPRLRFVRWSPIAGCDDPRIAILRGETMVWSSRPTDDGAQRHPHFERLASMLLRTTFHAAALARLTLRDVVLWIDSGNFMAPADIIEQSSSPEAHVWANELAGLGKIDPGERGSAFTTAANALGAFKLSTVLRNCETSDLDLRRFVETRSSLFLVADPQQQEALAPLFSSMLESIMADVLGDLARDQGGRIDPPLLVQLDEMANIAPLPHLSRFLTLCGGSGICLSYASQNWQQIATRYGQTAMKSIWQSTNARVVFGGVGDHEMLEELSQLMGTKTKKKTTKTKNPGRLRRSVTTGEEDVERLKLSEIFVADGSAHLFYRGGYEKVDPAPYYDARRGRPFHAAAQG